MAGYSFFGSYITSKSINFSNFEYFFTNSYNNNSFKQNNVTIVKIRLNKG